MCQGSIFARCTWVHREIFECLRLALLKTLHNDESFNCAFTLCFYIFTSTLTLVKQNFSKKIVDYHLIVMKIKKGERTLLLSKAERQQKTDELNISLNYIMFAQKQYSFNVSLFSRHPTLHKN